MTDEIVRVEIYGADSDSSSIGRLETYTASVPDRERALLDECNALRERVAELERELAEVHAYG